MDALLAGVAAGQVTPSEASEIARIIKIYLETLEGSQFDRGN